MKRSGQVALVLMGVTATTAAAAYMMPPRPECRAQPAASSTVNPPAAVTPGTQPAANPQTEPCRRRGWHSSGRSWGDWSWRTDSRNQRIARRTDSISTALRPPSQSGGRVGLTSPGSSSPGTRTGSSTPSRGGFGATGHGVSGGS